MEAQKNQITWPSLGSQKQGSSQQLETKAASCPLFLTCPKCRWGKHFQLIYHPFSFFLRSPVVRARKRTYVEPWVIGLISFLSLIVLAVCIGLTVHYVRYSKSEVLWHHVTRSNCSSWNFLFWLASGLFLHHCDLFALAKHSLNA